MRLLENAAPCHFAHCFADKHTKSGYPHITSEKGCQCLALCGQQYRTSHSEHLKRVTTILLKPPPPNCGRMPKKTDWRELAFAVAEEGGNELLDSRKSARVTKTNTSTYTICTDPTKHTMKYQLLRCQSEVCKHACSQVSCGWRGKVLTCSVTRKMAVYETGNYFSEVRSPRKAGLT